MHYSGILPEAADKGQWIPQLWRHHHYHGLWHWEIGPDKACDHLQLVAFRTACFSKGIPNLLCSIRGSILCVPPAICTIYLVHTSGTQGFEKSKRKNPAAYKNNKRATHLKNGSLPERGGYIVVSWGHNKLLMGWKQKKKRYTSGDPQQTGSLFKEPSFTLRHLFPPLFPVKSLKT